MQLFLLNVSPSHNRKPGNWVRASSLEHLFSSVRSGMAATAKQQNRKVCFAGRGNKRTAIFTTPHGREVERRVFEVVDQFPLRDPR